MKKYATIKDNESLTYYPYRPSGIVFIIILSVLSIMFVGLAVLIIFNGDIVDWLSVAILLAISFFGLFVVLLTRKVVDTKIRVDYCGVCASGKSKNYNIKWENVCEVKRYQSRMNGQCRYMLCCFNDEVYYLPVSFSEINEDDLIKFIPPELIK